LETLRYDCVLQPLLPVFGQIREFLCAAAQQRVTARGGISLVQGREPARWVLSPILSRSLPGAGGKWKGSRGLGALLLLTCEVS